MNVKCLWVFGQILINTKNQQIVFSEKSQDRIDLLGSRALNSIQSITNGVVEKEIQFTQSYLYSDENDPNVWTSKIWALNPEDIYEDVLGENEFARLKLDEVLIQGGSESLPPYKFQYNEDTFPPKTSFNTDHWGYYNGATNNTLLPYFRITDATNFGYGFCDDNFSLIFEYADKDADASKSQTGILESITSPTGFIQSFDYELHSFKKLNNENFSFSPNICDSVEFQFMVNHYSPNADFIIESFEIPEDFEGLLELEIEGKGALANYNPCFQWAFIANIKFTNLVTGNIVNLEPINGNDDYLIDGDGNFSFYKKTETVIEPGNYKITLSSDCIPNPNWDDNISNVEMFAKISNYCNTDKGAGLRVKKITNYDGVNNTIEKDYNYKNSGICHTYMTYGKKYILQLSGSGSDEPSSKLGSMFDLSSNSQVPFSNPFSSQLIGYSNVETSFNSEGENYGSQSSTYHIEQSTINPKARFGLFQTARFSSSRNGKLISQTIKDFKDRIVNKRTYTYYNFWPEFEWIWSFKVLPWLNLVDNIGTEFCADDLLISSQAFIPQWHRLTNVTEEKYGTEGNNALTTTTIYKYNPENYKTKSETISDGVISKTIDYKYAHDFDNQMLIDANMVGVLLWTQVNGGDGGGSQVNFKKHYGNILPEEYLTEGNYGEMSKVLHTLYYDDSDQYPDRIASRTKNNEDEITWGSTGEKGLVKAILSKDRLSEFDYNGFRKIEGITDFNSISSDWLYDGLQRPKESTSNNARLKSVNTYTYGLQSGAENIITNEMINSDGTGYNSSTIFDGMGRSIKTTKEGFLDSGTDHVSEVEYGPFGNVKYKIVPEDGGKTTYTYELSPLRRLLTTIPAGSTKSIVNKHKVEGNNLVLETTDENGNTTKSYTDIFGRQTKSIDGLGNTTSYTYNDRDQILTIQPPLGDPYVYTYYDDGLLKTKTIPDKGTFTYKHNSRDQLWRENLPNGSLLEYIYDSDYNDFLKMVKLDGVVIKEYDFHDPSKIKDWMGTETSAIFKPNGNISSTQHTIEYDYDEYSDDFGVPTSIITTTLDGIITEDLKYDNLGNATLHDKTITGFGGSVDVHNTSTFQKGIRRKSSWTTVGDVGIGTNLFKYDTHDWLEVANLGNNLQNIDYSYNDRGWLTGINSINSTYLGEDPCNIINVTPDDIDCEKLISIVQSYLIKYSCNTIQTDQPTGLKISKKVQYFEGERVAQAATINEYFIPINGGVNDGSIQYTDSINFDLNNSMESFAVSQGIVEVLIDCIQHNPQLLTIINEEIMSILGDDVNSTNPGGPSGVLSSTNNNDDVFGMEIHYTDGNGELGAAPQYNGNISWMEWRTKTDQRHAYGFTYDANNRLLLANYGEIKSPEDCELKKTDKYSVPFIKYDALGNIELFFRRGLTDFDDINFIPSYGSIDQLKYNYISGTSLLDNVLDGSSNNNGFQGSSSSYAYEFGNLISDSQKGIDQIKYTYNDLPLSINTNEGLIKNWYTADGLKIKSRSESTEQTTTRNYLGGAEYVNDQLESIYVEEGRIAYDNDLIYPEYLLKDHLGNVRARIADKDLNNLVYIDPNSPDKDELMNIRHYYPFGMEWDMPNFDSNGNSLEPTGVDNKYTYNGKEFLDDLDINLHDYGARYYDPAIAGWTSVDPLADSYASMSGYNYVANNPLLYTDPDGQQIIIGSKDSDGKITSVVYGEDGKLYNNDKEGAEYTGDNEYILEAKNAIDNLLKIDGVKDVVSDMISSEAIHGVQNFHYGTDGTVNESEYSQNYPRDGGGSSTKFMPDNDRARNNGRNKDFTDEEILAHELKHGYNREHKLRNFTPSNNSKVPYEELDATSFQNAVRSSDKRSLRTSYGQKDISRDLQQYGKYKTKKKKR